MMSLRTATSAFESSRTKFQHGRWDGLSCAPSDSNPKPISVLAHQYGIVHLHFPTSRNQRSRYFVGVGSLVSLYRAGLNYNLKLRYFPKVRDQSDTLGLGQMAWYTQGLQLGSVFLSDVRRRLSFSHLLSKRSRFGIVLVLGVFLCDSNQLVLAEPISVGNHFARTEQKQGYDPKPKIEIASPSSPLNRVPSGPPSHDDSPLWLVAVGAAFLIGFKISNWMNRQQAARLRKILHP